MLLIENNIQYAKSFRVTRNNNISVKKVLELPVSDNYIMTSSLGTVNQRNNYLIIKVMAVNILKSQYLIFTATTTTRSYWVSNT